MCMARSASECCCRATVVRFAGDGVSFSLSGFARGIEEREKKKESARGMSLPLYVARLLGLLLLIHLLPVPRGGRLLLHS